MIIFSLIWAVVCQTAHICLILIIKKRGGINMQSIENKVVIIIGASSGIGADNVNVSDLVVRPSKEA